MQIAEILKNLRVERRLTQKELADRLNIGQATVACYESGQREPHILNLIAYADFFECSLDFLAGRTDDFGNVVIHDTSATSLSLEEKNLWEKFRTLKPESRAKVLGYIDALTE